ncbi:MAG: hypothetical protein Tsb0034_02820 [Ekhidna sp.]
MSCGGGGDDPQPTAAELAAQNLVGGWSVNASAITYDGGTNFDGVWDNFVLTFTGDENGGTFSTQGVPTDGNGAFNAVWPAQGNWAFVDASADQIQRGDLVMDLNVSASSLTLSFTVPDQGNQRLEETNGIAGEWTFTFTAQ